MNPNDNGIDPLDTPTPPDGDRDTEDSANDEPTPVKIAYRKELDELSAFLKAREELRKSARRNFDKRYPGGE